VAQWEKTLRRVMGGQADTNVDFQDLCAMLPHVGYQAWRQHGSHHIFVHPDRPENINIQPGKSGKAKPYQVKQVRDVLRRYGHE
jgi:predicted RNA binding protein YcfA (HicA-like mRNA interferase family)